MADELERVWRGDADGEAFHGRALGPTLASVPAAAAGMRASPATHSIREILEHVLAWRAWALARVSGANPGDLENDGWTTLPPPTDAEWADLFRRARDGEDRLLAAVRALSDAEVERHGFAVRFVLHHDLHHGGQIALLASAARESRGTTT
jgi:hypothetical protein